MGSEMCIRDRFRIGLEVPAEPEHYAQIGLLAPENSDEAEAYQKERKEEGDASPADPRGIHLLVKASDGSPLVDLILGEEFGEIASRAPRGFVIRSTAKNPGIWKALGTLNKSTGDAESRETDKRRDRYRIRPPGFPTSSSRLKSFRVSR